MDEVELLGGPLDGLVYEVGTVTAPPPDVLVPVPGGGVREIREIAYDMGGRWPTVRRVEIARYHPTHISDVTHRWVAVFAGLE
jgi:hypothetical protein